MTTAAAHDALQDHQWKCQPEAEKFVRGVVESITGRLPAAAEFAARVAKESGNRLYDLIDRVKISTNGRLAEAKAAGWVAIETVGEQTLLQNPEGMFPLVIADGSLAADALHVELKVESVVDFLAAHELDHAIDGVPGAAVRSALFAQQGDVSLGVIERHGWLSLRPAPVHDLNDVRAVYESFRLRRREFANDDEGFAHGEKLIDAAIAKVGRDRACDIFFKTEREYWENRNRAARYQKARQDRLGLGWANHDHHTYRNSRRNFYYLVKLFEKLGFECRERFSPGVAAGWGAQVMEQPVCGLVTFNDVDISPAELLGDFSHRQLEPREKLHTVGLWCSLHGDSFLQAGMHHLECTFDFEALRTQLEGEAGIKVMKPFTDFTYLRQAFTEGERWAVKESRIQITLNGGYIDQAQAEKFRREGAIGSHLENLERNEGFKGFNQTGVTEIIAATDPRKQAALAGAH